MTTAGNAVQVVRPARRRDGAAEAQAVVADDQRTAAAYAQLALYLYADGQIEEGDEAGEQAVAAADPCQRKQVAEDVDAYREQAIKYQRQLESRPRSRAARAGRAAAQRPVR